MASQSTANETRAQLETLMSQWDARWRLRQVMLYLPRILTTALIAGMVVALVVGLGRLLPASRMLMLVGIVMGAIIATLVSGLGLLRKTGDEAARQFDEAFNMQERLSTALQIMDGRIKTTPQIAEHQLKDTYRYAREIDPEKEIRLKTDRLAWGIFAILIVPFLAVLFLMILNTWTRAGDGGTMNQATQQSVEAAASETRDITTDLATNSTLDDEERSSLLESAEQTLATLENPESSAEDAFVALEELENDLREQAQSLAESTESSETSLAEASEALSGEGNTTTGNDAANQLPEQLNELSESLDDLSAEDQTELEQRLEEAANATESTAPELSEALNQAAQSLQDGDIDAAQQSLNEAAQQAEATNEQNQSTQDTSDELTQQADRARDLAGDIATSEFNSNAQTEGEIDNTAQGLEEAGAEVSNIDLDEPEGGAGASNQDEPASPSDSGRAVESDDPNAQTANTAGQSPSASEQNSENQGSSSEGQEGGEGTSTSSGDSPQNSQEITGGGETPISEADTGSTDGGEEDFQELFVPNAIEQDNGNTNVELETDGGNTATVEGEFSENPTGSTSIPYNEIFTSYADEANSALQNGYIPFGVRDVVRDYFTSIEPTGNQSASDE